MGRTPRIRVAWRPKRLEQHRRFLLLLPLVALLHGALVVTLMAALRWPPFEEEPLGLLEVAVFAFPVAIAGALTGWILRIHIAQSRLPARILMAAVAAIMGGILSMLALFALLVPAGMLADGEGLGLTAGILLSSPVAALVFGPIFAFMALPIAWPLTWLAIEALHRVAGGTRVVAGGRRRTGDGPSTASSV